MKIINYRFEECDTKCDNCENKPQFMARITLTSTPN